MNLKKGLIFLWIPKCAGTSFVRSMQEKHSNFKVDYGKKEKLDFGTHGHVDIFSIYDKKELLKKNVVCISRNPYDRMVSLYFYTKKKKLHNFNEFFKFCDFVCNNKIPDVGNYNVKGLSQCNPQYRWVQGVDNLKVYKFEELDKLFSDFDIKYFHKNKTENRKKYQEYIKRKDIVEMINLKYEKDFSFFNYDKVL